MTDGAPERAAGEPPSGQQTMTADDIKAIEANHPCGLDGCYTCAALAALGPATARITELEEHVRKILDAAAIRAEQAQAERAALRERVTALETDLECLSDAAQHVVNAVNHATTAGDNGEIYTAAELLAALLADPAPPEGPR